MVMYFDLECTETKEEKEDFWQKLNYVISFVGIAGNLISILILIKKEFRETFHRLLLGLAIVDFGYVLSVDIREVLRSVRESKTQLFQEMNATFYNRSQHNFSIEAIEAHEQRIEQLTNDARFWTDFTDIFSFLLRYMYFASIYFILAISCERYFGVCYPLQSRTKGGKRFYLYLFPVLIFSLFTELPNIIVVLKQIYNMKFMTEEEKVYKVWFDYLKPIFTIYLPLFILIVLNIRIFVAIKNSRKSLRTNNNGTDREKNFATILVSIVLLFLFTHSLRVLDPIFRDSTEQVIQHCIQRKEFPVIPRWLRTLNLMVQPAGLINASINFIIYCLAGTRFRTVLIRSARATLSLKLNRFSTRNTEYIAMSQIRSRTQTPKGEIVIQQGESCVIQSMRGQQI